MTGLAAVQVIVYGRVQGVFFRAFAARWADELGLSGYVRNLSGGAAVEVTAEGARNKLQELIKHLRAGPPAAEVAKIKTRWSGYTGSYSGFSVRY